MSEKYNFRKVLSYPKGVYIIWIISFVLGFELFGAFLIPFFKDWGGLNQFQIQTLQSWFMLMIFVLEIPTGLIGDVKGRKFSVAMGYLLGATAPLVYTLVPDFKVFLLGEFLLAMSVAFISGSLDALLYDTLKEKGYEKSCGDIQNISHNLKLVGMIASSFAGNYLIRHFEVQELFRMYSITFLIAFFSLIFFIKEPKIKDKKEYIPKYDEIFKKALDNLKSNLSLRRLVVYMTMISAVAYFFIWFYQVLLLNIGISKEHFGDYRVILVIAEIILSVLIIRILNLVDEKKRRLLIIIVTILVSLGFFSGVLIKNQIGIILFVVLAGGIGLKFRNIFAQFVNAKIDSTERATTLSAVSMFRRIALVVLNPIIGYFSDINLDYTLLGLGLVGIVSVFLFLPKREDFRLSGK